MTPELSPDFSGELSEPQRAALAGFRDFVDSEVVPHADRYHYEQHTPRQAITQMAERGYLGLSLPPAAGGGGHDQVTLGLLHQEFGRGCASLRSLLTVHGMVSHSILRWGSKGQKEQWLSLLATGKVIGAFALSEPTVGSDAKAVTTEALETEDGYVLRGEKKWITYGQIADLFLVFARCQGQPTAFLVERDTPGLSLEPISDLLGLRASMTARVRLQGCRVPKANLLGRIGFGVSHIAASALELGRSTVAWGCVGLAQACADACLSYTNERSQFGVRLREHPLILQLLSDMLTDLTAARLLCLHCSRLRDSQDPESAMATAMAKYFASKAAVAAALSAVQIHGANGCSREYPIQRHLGDAKIMEIIEGSSQIQQLSIARYGYQQRLSVPGRGNRPPSGEQEPSR